MALIAVPPFYIPTHSFGAAAALFTDFVIDAAGEKAAFVFAAPKAGVLDQFEFRCGAVSLNGASVIRCSFQNVSATTGNPDETQDQYRDIATPSSDTWVVPGLITSDGTDTGTKRTVVANEPIACVIEYQTFTAADSFIVSYNGSGTLAFTDVSSYRRFKFGGSWSGPSDPPSGVLKYNDGTYGQLTFCLPFLAQTITAFNSGSTPDEIGLIFSFPCPVKIGGLWVRILPGATNSYDLVLYDSDGTTALKTVTIDSDQGRVTTSTTRVARFADVTLAANTAYRIAVKPGGTNVTIYDCTVNSVAILDAFPGGQNFYLTSRTDAGAWTETTTRKPDMGVIITAVDNGASGGGLLVHPGMTGGFRG